VRGAGLLSRPSSRRRPLDRRTTGSRHLTTTSHAGQLDEQVRASMPRACRAARFAPNLLPLAMNWWCERTETAKGYNPECEGLKDRESVSHPVFKTGDSRFESRVPRSP